MFSDPTPSRRALRNPLKAKIKAGLPVFGIMVTIPSVQVIQILTRTGFDYIKLDLEHSPISIESVHSMVAATSGTQTVPVARVPGRDSWMLKSILDVGVLGICFPLSRSAADVDKSVRSVLYPPEGERGCGPFCAQYRWDLSVPDYIKTANTQIVTEILIEHIDAVRNIDQILEIPGVDTAFIAPMDLAVSLGVGGNLEHPELKESIAAAEKAILKSKVALGGFSLSGEHTKQLMDRGYKVITLGFDFALLHNGAKEILRAIDF